MIQVYVLSLLYIFLGAFFLLLEDYQGTFIFFLDIKNNMYKSRIWQLLLLPFGLGIFAGLLLSPISPGPMFIGDLIPAIVVLALVIHYFIRTPGSGFKAKINRIIGKDRRVVIDFMIISYKAKNFKIFCGKLVLFIGFLHYFFPGLVLL